MLISSKFHDYYDTATSYGMDKTVVYQRVTSEVPFNHKGFFDTELRAKDGAKIILKRKLLGYCGKIIPIVVATKGDLVVKYYKAEDLINMLKREGVKLRAGGRSFFSHMDSVGGIMDFFAENYSELLEVFRKYNVPLFIIAEREKLILNPSLKDEEFFKLRNPYSCFQDIFMYLSGVLGTPKESPIEISDKIKLLKRGFFEWSFKKLPGGKKRRKDA